MSCGNQRAKTTIEWARRVSPRTALRRPLPAAFGAASGLDKYNLLMVGTPGHRGHMGTLLGDAKQILDLSLYIHTDPLVSGDVSDLATIWGV